MKTTTKLWYYPQVCLTTLFLISCASPVSKEAKHRRVSGKEVTLMFTKTQNRGSAVKAALPQSQAYHAMFGKQRSKRSPGSAACRDRYVVVAHSCFDAPIRKAVCKNSTTSGCFHLVATRSIAACKTKYESVYSTKCGVNVVIPVDCDCDDP